MKLLGPEALKSVSGGKDTAQVHVLRQHKTVCVAQTVIL